MVEKEIGRYVDLKIFDFLFIFSITQYCHSFIDRENLSKTKDSQNGVQITTNNSLNQNKDVKLSRKITKRNDENGIEMSTENDF